MEKLTLMLDSGAFSSFTQGKLIDVIEYSDFILKNQQHIDQTICLDVINPNKPDEAAVAGMQNFKYMKGRGIDAIPVFHAREPLSCLDEMLTLTEYVGLSATSLVSPVEDKAWHRLIWAYLSDSEGYPIIKTHSFGNITEYALLSWPWTSADAATWVIAGGRAGRVRINGRSIQLRTNKINDPNFISIHDTGLKRETWEMEIRELGLDPHMLMTVKTKGSGLAMLRSFLVASDLLKLQEQTIDVTQYKTHNPLLLKKKIGGVGIKREGPVNMYFVISPSAYQFNFPVLAALKIKNILVSYYYVKTATKNFWDEKLIPFLYDPVGFCETDKRTKSFWDLLQSCLQKETAQEVGNAG
jgi:hypothetical protein